MTDISPIVWMLLAGAVFVAAMVWAVEPARRVAHRWGDAWLGVMALRLSPDADARRLPPARNRDGAWRLTMPEALTWRLFTGISACFMALGSSGLQLSVRNSDLAQLGFGLAVISIAGICVWALMLWRIDIAVTVDDDRIAATRISGAPKAKTLWSHPISDLTAVEEKGREVLLTFGAAKTRALPRGLEGRMWLADHLRHRMAERTAA